MSRMLFVVQCYSSRSNHRVAVLQSISYRLPLSLNLTSRVPHTIALDYFHSTKSPIFDRKLDHFRKSMSDYLSFLDRLLMLWHFCLRVDYKKGKIMDWKSIYHVFMNIQSLKWRNWKILEVRHLIPEFDIHPLVHPVWWQQRERRYKPQINHCFTFLFGEVKEKSKCIYYFYFLLYRNLEFLMRI